MYFFSTLALTLNEPEDGVAPTDSRRRPDQRLMEEGHWDEANAEKQRLEEKQRMTRREREREAVKVASSPEEGKKRRRRKTKEGKEEEMLYVSCVSVLQCFSIHSSLVHFVCLCILCLLVSVSTLSCH